MKRLTLVALAVLAAVGGPGCYSTATGYQGKITFGYESNPSDFGNFVKPIAPGAKLDVVAFANGSEKTLVITKVTSSKPNVVTATAKDDRTITLVGGEAGVADIEIAARDLNGVVQTDHMFFHVARPQRHLLAHGCTEKKEAIYVRGDVAWVSHDMKTSDNRPVVGYDYVPITVEGGAKLVEQSQSFPGYLYELPKQNGKVTLTSTIDRTAITFNVVDQGDLTNAALLDPRARAFEGYRGYVRARVTSGATPVCSQNALTRARSLTPDVCGVSANLEDDEDAGGGGKDENHEQMAVVDAKKFGVCKYEITLPELAGGKGVTLAGEIEVGRVEFPSDKKEQFFVPTPPAHRAHHCGGSRGSRWLSGGALIGLICGLFVLPNLLGIALLRLRRRS